MNKVNINADFKTSVFLTLINKETKEEEIYKVEDGKMKLVTKDSYLNSINGEYQDE